MKILIWDIETTPSLLEVLAYDLRVNISRFDYRDIKRDWSILCAAWKCMDGEIHTACIDPRYPFDDEKIVRKLHKVLTEADMLVGHNADAFDLKKFNTRAIYHGLDPVPEKPSVDTLKLARKHFKFTSNKLAYIAQFLKIGSKDESPDWKLVMGGNRAEIARMKAYNVKDVEVTERVYKKLRAWGSHPNMNTLAPIKDIAGEKLPQCVKCGSVDLIKNGIRLTESRGREQRLSCRNCGGHSYVNNKGKIR